jgi:hypothetical protein
MSATFNLFRSLATDQNRNVSYLQIFDQIVPAQEGDAWFVGDFNIELRINVMYLFGGSHSDLIFNDPRVDVVHDREYEILVQLYRPSDDTAVNLHQHGFKIGSSIRAIGKVGIDEWIQIIRVQKLQIPDPDLYAIRMLIREKSEANDQQWTLQAIKPLLVGAPKQSVPQTVNTADNTLRSDLLDSIH